MKKLLFLLMLPLVLVLSGCDDEGRKKVNPKKLEGIWEVYDAAWIQPVGSLLTFLGDGRFIVRDQVMMGASFNKYTIDDNKINLSGVLSKRTGCLECLSGEYTMSFEKRGLYLNQINIGNDVFWMKLKKVEELPCDA